MTNLQNFSQTVLLLGGMPGSTMPREYLAMLYRNEANRNMIYNSREDEERRKPKWVVVPYNLTIDTCIGLVNLRTPNPFLIRSYLEGRKQRDVEGRGIAQIESITSSAYRK